MTIAMPMRSAQPDLLADDNVLPALNRWQAEGRRCALVTLVGVEGGAPRQPGAQMAVCEDGRNVGYLSGGCLEAAVAQEAVAAMAEGKNRLVRFGKGSHYFDLRLPCGSGLDIYFDQAIGAQVVRDLVAAQAARKVCVLTTDLASGTSVSSPVVLTVPMPRSTRQGERFSRYYPPPPKLLLLGTGPSVGAIAALAQVTGLDVSAWSPDEATRHRVVSHGLAVVHGQAALARQVAALDAASAVVLVFHDHAAEPEILSQILATQCFYIGVLGNHAVHRERLAALQASGFDATARARLRAPVGSIPAAKSQATLALGVVTELMAEAKVLNLVA